MRTPCVAAHLTSAKRTRKRTKIECREGARVRKGTFLVKYRPERSLTFSHRKKNETLRRSCRRISPNPSYETLIFQPELLAQIPGQRRQAIRQHATASLHRLPRH